MISPDDLQAVKLVTFTGNLTYNANGFAVLPPYVISNILGSVQPLSKSDLKFLPQGTHYADFLNIYTDNLVTVDTTNNGLGNYFIWKNNVFKIVSCQDYRHFTAYSTNHIATLVSRDNRITYNGTALNIPFPEVDSSYAPLFELIAFCSTSTNGVVPVVWAFQQELMPPFPFCVVNIESVTNLDNTPFREIDGVSSEKTWSKSSILLVSYKFYSFDKIQTYTLMSQFKLKFAEYVFSSNKIAFAGWDSNEVFQEELYENRTIFSAEAKVNFNLIVELKEVYVGNETIETVAASLSFSI